MLKAKQIITPGAHNTLAEGTVLIGEIRAEEDFRIDGVVEGVINCNGKIVIGPKGIVKAQVNCANVELMGKLQGTIRTTGALVLKSTAVYLGDAIVRTMEIEPGAIFNGSCTMVDDSSPNNRASAIVDVSSSVETFSNPDLDSNFSKKQLTIF